MSNDKVAATHHPTADMDEADAEQDARDHQFDPPTGPRHVQPYRTQKGTRHERTD